MVNKKNFVLVFLTFTILLILLSFSVYAQTSNNTTENNNKLLPLSDWNETKLLEFHYSPQIKTRLNGTFYPLQVLMVGKADKGDKNKTWDNRQQSIFHYASDINVFYNDDNYSLQDLIDFRGIRVDGGENFPPVSFGDISPWDDSEHLAWHSASEIRVRIRTIYYSLQYAIDNGLIRFPNRINRTRETVVLTFSVPAGSKDEYDTFCRRVRTENFASLNDKINASVLDQETIYKVSCSYGGGDYQEAYSVKFNSTYSEFFNSDEKHISRIVLGNEISRGKDTFIWELKLDENKELNINVKLAQLCQRRLSPQIDISQCNLLFGQNEVDSEASTGDVIQLIRTLNNLRQNSLTPGSSGECQIPYQANNIGNANTQSYNNCGNGQCSGSEWALGNCINDCGASSCTSSSNANNERLFSLDCSDALRMTFGVKCVEFNFCPVYKAPVGLGPGIVRNQEIYAWDKVDCKVIA